MRGIVTRLRSDKQREKVLVTDWPDPGKPTGNKVRTRTLFSGVTNGTERNDLLRGNYSHRDDELPAGRMPLAEAQRPQRRIGFSHS